MSLHSFVRLHQWVQKGGALQGRREEEKASIFGASMLSLAFICTFFFGAYVGAVHQQYAEARALRAFEDGWEPWGGVYVRNACEAYTPLGVITIYRTPECFALLSDSHLRVLRDRTRALLEDKHALDRALITNSLEMIERELERRKKRGVEI